MGGLLHLESQQNMTPSGRTIEMVPLPVQGMRGGTCGFKVSVWLVHVRATKGGSFGARKQGRKRILWRGAALLAFDVRPHTQPTTRHPPTHTGPAVLEPVVVVVVAAGRESWAFLARSAVPISSIAPPSSSILSTSKATSKRTTPPHQASQPPPHHHTTRLQAPPPPVANEGARQTESRAAGPGVDMPRGLYPSLSQNTSTSRYVLSRRVNCVVC